MSDVVSIEDLSQSVLAQVGTGGGGGGGAQGGGGWDLVEFFTNGQDYAQTAMAAFLGLVGVVAIGWSAFLIVKKLSSERSQEGWPRIIGLLFVGGLALFGGWNMFSNLASGAKDTVDEFGGTTTSMGSSGIGGATGAAGGGVSLVSSADGADPSDPAGYTAVLAGV